VIRTRSRVIDLTDRSCVRACLTRNSSLLLCSHVVSWEHFHIKCSLQEDDVAIGQVAVRMQRKMHSKTTIMRPGTFVVLFIFVQHMAKKSVVARSQKKPKYSTREVNRCFRCGRAKGYMRDFDLCRICFRELANEGRIPGIKKSSW